MMMMMFALGVFLSAKLRSALWQAVRPVIVVATGQKIPTSSRGHQPTTSPEAESKLTAPSDDSQVIVADTSRQSTTAVSSPARPTTLTLNLPPDHRSRDAVGLEPRPISMFPPPRIGVKHHRSAYADDTSIKPSFFLHADNVKSQDPQDFRQKVAADDVIYSRRAVASGDTPDSGLASTSSPSDSSNQFQMATPSSPVDDRFRVTLNSPVASPMTGFNCRIAQTPTKSTIVIIGSDTNQSLNLHPLSVYCMTPWSVNDVDETRDTTTQPRHDVWNTIRFPPSNDADMPIPSRLQAVVLPSRSITEIEMTSSSVSEPVAFLTKPNISPPQPTPIADFRSETIPINAPDSSSKASSTTPTLTRSAAQSTDASTMSVTTTATTTHSNEPRDYHHQPRLPLQQTRHVTDNKAIELSDANNANNDNNNNINNTNNNNARNSRNSATSSSSVDSNNKAKSPGLKSSKPLTSKTRNQKLTGGGPISRSSTIIGALPASTSVPSAAKQKAREQPNAGQHPKSIGLLSAAMHVVDELPVSAATNLVSSGSLESVRPSSTTVVQLRPAFSLRQIIQNQN